jgi:hypothetical protein
MSIEAFLIISHLDSYLETTLQLPVKVYQVRIDIIYEGTVGPQTYWDCESAAERLDITSGRVALPKLHQVRYQPSLAAGPFQRGLRRGIKILSLRWSWNQVV